MPGGTEKIAGLLFARGISTQAHTVNISRNIFLWLLPNIAYATWKIVLRNLNYLQCLDMVLKAGFMASVQYNPSGKGMMVHSMLRGMNLSIENYSSLIGWANLLKLNFFWTSPQGKPPLKTKMFWPLISETFQVSDLCQFLFSLCSFCQILERT